jgi:hypothetical protein
MESKDQKKKPYFPPALTRLIPEQVKKLMADRKNAARTEAADFLKCLRRRNQHIAADQKRERPTIERHAHLFTNPNSTLSGSADTERDGAGDVRLAIGDDRNRQRDRVSFLASPLPEAIWRSLGL